MNSAFATRPTPRHRHPVAGALLVALLVAAWLLAAGVLGGPDAGSTRAPSAPMTVQADALLPVSSTSYVVQPGDTLWSVARGLQPSGDVRPLVDRLARQAGGSQLRTGQRIQLP